MPGIPVFNMGQGQSPVNICKAAVEHGRSHGNDVIILDTAWVAYMSMMSSWRSWKGLRKPWNPTRSC